MSDRWRILPAMPTPHYPVAAEMTATAATIECCCGWSIRVEHQPGCTCDGPQLLDLAVAAGDSHVLVERLRHQYRAGRN